MWRSLLGVFGLVFAACAHPATPLQPAAAPHDVARIESVLREMSQRLDDIDARLARVEKEEAKPPRTPVSEPSSPAPGKGKSSSPKPKPQTTKLSRRFAPDRELLLCPGMKVTNRPRARANRRVVGYRPFVRVAGRVRVAVAPQNGACLASGFGPRWGRLHKGLDYHARPAPLIYAAAAGTVREASFHPGYGNMVLIDHGEGVFTRYAHLEKIRKHIVVGRNLAFGTPLGTMGRTAKVMLPLHLHYEILIGKYGTPKKSFGLKPINPFRLLSRNRVRRLASSPRSIHRQRAELR